MGPPRRRRRHRVDRAFTTRADAAGHLHGGVQRVIISAPSSDADHTFVIGVNDDEYDPEKHVVVSNASCTTNCFVPMVKVLDDNFRDRQRPHDDRARLHERPEPARPHPHRPAPGPGRAVNIVPSSTGAARATSLVLAAMKGRLDGMSLRVPLPVGSITDFTAVVKGNPSVAEVNAAFAEASAKPPLDRVLDYTEDPLVSSDIVGRPPRASSTPA